MGEILLQQRNHYIFEGNGNIQAPLRHRQFDLAMQVRGLAVTEGNRSCEVWSCGVSLNTASRLLLEPSINLGRTLSAVTCGWTLFPMMSVVDSACSPLGQ